MWQAERAAIHADCGTAEWERDQIRVDVTKCTVCADVDAMQRRLQRESEKAVKGSRDGWRIAVVRGSKEE